MYHMAEGVNPTVIGPTGYGNDNSSQALGTGLLAAAALSQKGYNGYYDGGLGITSQNGICDLRHDVAASREVTKDAECNIRHDIGQAECSINNNVLKAEADIRREVAKEASDMKFQLHDNIVAAERNLNNRFGLVDTAVLRAEYEAKLTAQNIIKEVNEKAQYNADRIQDRLDAIDLRFTDKVCDVERRSGERFAALSHQLEECCCTLKTQHAVEAAREAGQASATQTGLLNTIVTALNTKGNQ